MPGADQGFTKGIVTLQGILNVLGGVISSVKQLKTDLVREIARTGQSTDYFTLLLQLFADFSEVLIKTCEIKCGFDPKQVPAGGVPRIPSGRIE